MAADLVVLAVIVTAALGIGLAVGILVAPYLTRFAERDEEPVDGDD